MSNSLFRLCYSFATSQRLELPGMELIYDRNVKNVGREYFSLPLTEIRIDVFCVVGGVFQSNIIVYLSDLG